ncbi:hypothetical protein FMEXI_6389 [Fusarium mexicanum]|uniref:PA14 domain-containing protein n=1 Tax=Fusarium mexicanum TaxID=751941 RepID=A0A8H5MYC1_9HYPO|nr:hypothetical protein FMEXI_6389 [Fusarium mexicanum]
MHSKKLLSLALSLFIAEAVVASPCKPKTTTSVASTTLSDSTTTIPSVPSTTETTLATIETSAASETSETENETATTLLTSTTAAPEVDTTTTEEGTTTAEETTTAEATTTTAGEPACAQTFVIANPTPIFDSESTNDDSARSIVAPFPIGVFGTSSTNVFVTTNGMISLGDYSLSYANDELPVNSLPATSIMPYWDDLTIRAGACNTGIYYDVYQSDRGNTLTIEWQLGSVGLGASTGEHFSASFYQDFPGVVRFEYYQTTKHGSSATVGLQNDQQFSQYSVNQENSIPNQFYIVIDTSSGDAVTLSGSL